MPKIICPICRTIDLKVTNVTQQHVDDHLRNTHDVKDPDLLKKLRRQQKNAWAERWEIAATRLYELQKIPSEQMLLFMSDPSKEIPIEELRRTDDAERECEMRQQADHGIESDDASGEDDVLEFDLTPAPFEVDFAHEENPWPESEYAGVTALPGDWQRQADSQLPRFMLDEKEECEKMTVDKGVQTDDERK